MKPLFIPPQSVMPLPAGMLGSHCSMCDKPQASWLVSQIPTCSLCFLYKSDWAAENEKGLRVFVEEVEKLKHVVFPKTTDGCLINAQDADSLLMGIAIESRVFAIRARYGVSDDS